MRCRLSNREVSFVCVQCPAAAAAAAADAAAAALCCYTAVVAGAAAVLLLAATVRHGVSFRSVPQKGPSTMFLRTVL